VKYLRFRLAPEEVLRMVEEGKITQGDAEKATLAGYPDKEKIIRVAQAIAERRLTKEQTRRLPDIAKEHPEASADQLIREAKKRPIRLIIPVPTSLLEALDRAAKDYVMDRKDVAKMALSAWLTNMGYLVD
jgi:hypothetical protein